MGVVYELPKKRGVPPPLSSTHCPFTEEAIAGLRGVHLLIVAVTTKRPWCEATKKKQRSHPLPVFDAFTPLQRVDLILAIHAFTAIRRSAH